MVQMCKTLMSPGVFFNFKILIFQVVKGLNWQKMAQNDKKFVVSLCISGTIHHIIVIFSLYISGNIHHIIVIFGTHVQNDDILANFCILQNFDFVVFMGVKGQKIT